MRTRASVIGALALLFISLATARAAPKPTTTPTPRPIVVPTKTSGKTIEGTVAAIFDNEITVNLPNGKLETVTIPSKVPVVRDAMPSSLAQIQATDRIFIQRSQSGKILSVLAISVKPTPGITPTTPARATATAAAPQATSTVASTVITGSVMSVSRGTITISADDGTTRRVSTASVSGLRIERNGRKATVKDIKPGDNISVTKNAAGKPVSIVASSSEVPVQTRHDLSWIWMALVMLIPLILLLAIPLKLHRRSLPLFQRPRR